VLPTRQQVTVKTSGSLDTYGYLLDSSGSQIDYNDDYTDLNFQIIQTLNPGIYYVRLHTYAKSSSGGYQLNISGQPIPEPEIRITGNTLEIQSGDTTPSSSDFTNFYNAVFTNGSGVQVDRTFIVDNIGNADLTLNGNPAVSITGPDAVHFKVVSKPSYSIAAGQSSSFVLRFSPLSTGDFTATVNIGNNDSDESLYSFTISGSGISTTDDYGNTFTDATLITVPSNQNGVINNAGDVDMFKFTITTTSTVIVTSSGQTDVVAYLYNSSGTLLASDDDGAGVPNFRITANLSPGTYYVKVAGYDSTTSGAYSLNVSR